MSEALYGVYGASGCGREIMPLAREQLRAAGRAGVTLVFIDDALRGRTINGHRVLSYDEFVAAPAAQRSVAIAIADGVIRERLALRCIGDGITPWSVSAQNIVLMDDVEIGEGALLSPFVTLTSNVRVGRYFQANLYSYVTHDCVIGDFVTFAPGVKCNGNVVIEDHVYVGTGAMIRQGRPGRPLVIGRGAVVGMGAVVTKDVAAETTVVGSPAKPISKD